MSSNKNDDDDDDEYMTKIENNRMSDATDSKRIRSVSLYRLKDIGGGVVGNKDDNFGGDSDGSGELRKRGKRRSGPRPYHLLFLVLYVYQGIRVLSTVGEPYRKFLEKADRDGFDVMEGTTKARAELEFALKGVHDPDRPKEKMGWFDWAQMDIEEQAKRKKEEKEKNVIDSIPKHMRVPKRYNPEFVPMLIMGILLTLHALVVLLQHWSVSFNVKLNFNNVDAQDVQKNLPPEFDDLEQYHNSKYGRDDNKNGAPGVSNSNSNTTDDTNINTPGEIVHDLARNQYLPRSLPTHARITPSAGKDVLVPLLYLPTLGVTFEYHRRRYVYDHDNQIWSKIRCRTDMPVSFFASWIGFDCSDRVAACGVRFGRNVFDVKQPSFRELYEAQLLSPFTVFQLFCVLLWMLDDYWYYSFFTLFMILVFEATVVFSRVKCLSALKGMGNGPRPLLVYRMERWIVIGSQDLLPGDIVSLTKQKRAKNVDGGKQIPPIAADGDGDIVPADLLLLRGSVVVSEASLTGESVPQVKEGLGELTQGDALGMKDRHKSHVLYAGTKMLQCKGLVDVESERQINSDTDEEGQDFGDEKGNSDTPEVFKGKRYESISVPDDGGALCFVLRTGFSSAQGKLVRMIEGSQEKVKGHERETALLLLLLFFFACASSSYVLYHGLRDEKRSQYELLLHCILIVTSVIPPELPMQMALAVNNSLMTLMKLQIFCTEPYRVPIAGKLDACLFDKTGTLTTDELVAAGVCEVKSLCSLPGKQSNTKAPSPLQTADLITPMTKIRTEAALILAGCHSLVLIDDEITGDPLESAALAAMRWGLDGTSGHAVPMLATEKKQAGRNVEVSGVSIPEVEVVTRHHFSSKLQRMSCVVRDVKNRRNFSVAKGSPEAIFNLLQEKPDGYETTAKILSKKGYRVIAMGYKPLLGHEQIENAKEKRTSCEEGIIFAGFIAFTCRVRKDTKVVLSKLKEGGMSIAMVTGDALLTAAHVAKEVGICDNGTGDENIDTTYEGESEELKELLDKRNPQTVAMKKKKDKIQRTILILEKDKSGIMFWQSYDDDSRIMNFDSSDVKKLSEKFDLAVTGKMLAAAFEFDEGTTKVLAYFKIFARMTPDAKETVIECLHSVGALCLMCGDGANDVGALKQADVGVALLSGFGDLNVDKGEDGNKKGKMEIEMDKKISETTIITQEQLQALRMCPMYVIKAKIIQLGVDPNKYPQLVEKEDMLKLYQIKAKEHAIKAYKKKKFLEKKKTSGAEMQVKNKSLMVDKQKRMALRTQELEAQGVQWANFKAMKEFMASEMAEAKKKKADMARHSGVEGQAAKMAANFDDLELDEIPMVKLGDASIAAPFTSKAPSIKSCVDIVRQGRCTLVTSMQMYQILALNCLISSYSLSVLYLDGVKYGDTQMTAMGMLMSVAFMSVSRSKPLQKLSPVKPLNSIFHPSMFISLLGQFFVHLFTMMWAVRSAKKYLPDDHEVDLDGQFKPSIFNSVVFLVSNVQQTTVFVVNLQGRPFMTGLTENRPLLWSLISTFILTFMFASESIPSLNKYFQLVPFPNDEFRDFLIKILVGDVLITFVWDRLMKLLFCPQILYASVKDTTLKDVFKLCRTFAIILAVMYMFVGNNEQWDELMRIQEETEIGDGLNSSETIEMVNVTSGIGINEL